MLEVQKVPQGGFSRVATVTSACLVSLSLQREAVGSTALRIASFKVTLREVLIQLLLDSEASLVKLVLFYFIYSVLVLLFCFVFAMDG